MISFREAMERMLGEVILLPEERCRIEDAAGRVMRREVRADRDFPGFDRVMMDGYALRMADWEAGCRVFRVTGSAPAGVEEVAMDEEQGTCVEVMTGAPCPVGADAIVPVEDTAVGEDGRVRISESADPVVGRFLHRRGSDARAGEVLLRAGTVLGAREIGVAASCGAGWLEVSARPRIAVVATGDELVTVDEVPAAHQIRQSNGHALAAALERAGHPVAETAVLTDEAVIAEPVLAALLERNGWVVLTGAVSMGGRDFVPRLLEKLGCRKVFHGVAHRPGKPAGCWIGPGGQMVVALPGNPVSALTGLHVFVLPALAVAGGSPLPDRRLVELDDGQTALTGFTRHLPVKLRADGRAEAAATGNSGDFIGLLRSDGFVTLPPRSESGAASAAVPYTPWF